MLKLDARDKEKLVDPLYQISRRFWLVVIVLLAIIGWGGYMYIRQVVDGLGNTNLNRPVFWGVYMVNFIFLIGVSMAGTLISAVLQILGANWRRPITRIAETLTVFGLIVAGMQILFDMGRPERMGYVFFYGRLQSPLLWDAISLTVYIMTSIFALYLQLLPDIALLRDNLPYRAPQWRKLLYTILSLGWRGTTRQWVRLEKAISIVSILIIPIGVSLHTVTSWIFSTTVQPGWKSTILGPYFVIGAVYSGIGMLLLVMTWFRYRRGLHDYIQEDPHYRNLWALFIVMNLVWFYFTYTEHLTLLAGQETMEFPVLASKLWGEFAPTFWGMVLLMIIAFWLLVAPKLLPNALRKVTIFQPRMMVLSLIAAVVLFVMVAVPELFTPIADLADPALQVGLSLFILLLLFNAAIGLALWCKDHFITSLMFVSICVVVGMWLERWNIIIPTVTHPRLISYAIYMPSITEIAVSLASFSLLILCVVVFFKLFPVISIWEVAEGRVIDEAYEHITIPMPQPSNVVRRLGEWGFGLKRK